MPPPAIPLQDGGTPLKNGSDAEPATEPFSFLLGGAMPEPEPALPVSTLAAIVRGSAPSSPPAALESIPALSVEALEAPSGLLLEDESPPASAESPAAPTSHDLAGPAPSLVEPALPVPLQFDPALGLLFLQPPPDADDLTQIRGISSTLAARLAELGIYTFRQIAAWDDNQVREFSHRLAFKDRIDREQWVEQARALAEKKTHKPEKEHGTPEGADGPPTAKHR
jgi:NADH-quinone oxidoreductase subunit E